MNSAIAKEYKDKGSKKPYIPSIREKERVSYVEEQYQLSEAAKLQVVKDTWLAVSFFSGRQWSTYNRVTRLLEEPQPPSWRVRMILNYILPTVETLCGKLVENRPGVTVLPASSDDDDIEAARQSERLIEHLWHELNMQLKLHEASKWMATSGTAFFKVWWDPEAGSEYESDAIELDEAVERYEELTDEDAPEPKKKKRLYRKTGAPVVDVLSVLDVGWDPGAKDIETARWMVHANPMHIDQVRAMWEKAKHVAADYTYVADEYSAQVLKDFSYNVGYEEKNTDRVLCLEYFERPSPRHPNGYYAITCGGLLMEESEELPYGDFPFVMARHITTPGRFSGDGIVKHIIAPQKALNKAVSQRIENKDLHAMPKWRAEKGSIDKSQITDQPGEIIMYNRTATRPPEPLPPPPLSPEHRLIEKEQIDHIEAISGISDVSRGQAAAGSSGRLVGLLSDLDQTKLGPTVRELEAAVEKIARLMLMYWRDFMPIEQTIKVAGKDNIPEVFSFHASQVRSTDVRIVANSMLPKHPSYRREQIMQMFQVGILGDPNDPQTKMAARKMMEFGGSEFEGDDSKDRQYAREENHVLMNGRQTEVQPWEDHVVHIDELMHFMKSVDYRLLSPDIQSNFVQHLAMHYYYESQAQQGVPWWQEYVGAPGMPPGTPPEEVGELVQVPQPVAGPPEGGGPPPGLMGGGTPEMNQAMGTRGPGVAEYEYGFETGPR